MGWSLRGGGAVFSSGRGVLRTSAVCVFFPAKGIDPTAAVSRSECGKSQRAQAHIFPRRDQLTEALLMRKRITGASISTSSQAAKSTATCYTSTAHSTPSTPIRLPLFLQHKLSVAHLQRDSDKIIKGGECEGITRN